MTTYVIAEIVSGLITNDEFYRERHSAVEALRNYDGNIYTVMKEEEANEVNLDYITSELAKDIEGNPDANAANEDKIEEIRENLIREAEEAEATEEEGWYHR